MGNTKDRAGKIATERIHELFALAKKEYLTHPDDARNYITRLREMATKHNIKITDIKRSVCKKCNTLLVPGKTASVRIRDKIRVITCKHCGQIKRIST